MTHLLYISASPRGEDSASMQGAGILLAALGENVQVTHVDLFERSLPEVTAATTAAKSKTLMGVELNDEEATAWQGVLTLVEEFKNADHYVFAIPMWNYGIPYKLKQYIDLITHMGVTFAYVDGQMQGLMSGSATYIYARGGDYSPKDGQPDPFDHQSPYMQAWAKMVGLGPVNEVLIQRTMAGPTGVADALQGAAKQLTEIAQGIS